MICSRLMPTCSRARFSTTPSNKLVFMKNTPTPMQSARQPLSSEQEAGLAVASFNLNDYLCPGKHLVSGSQFIKTRNYVTGGKVSWRSKYKQLMRSHSHREKHCYELMQSVGVPCPKVIAVTDKRSRFGFLQSTQIAIEYIAGTIDLRLIATVEQMAPLRRNSAWRRQVVCEVGRWVRHMHEHHLYPQKLHFGNILVVPDPALPQVQVYFIDITSNMKGSWGMCGHKRIKDIAYLYREARQWCTLRERIRFMHVLCGRRKLTAADRAFMRQVVAYAERKWGDKTSLGIAVDKMAIPRF